MLLLLLHTNKQANHRSVHIIKLCSSCWADSLRLYHSDAASSGSFFIHLIQSVLLNSVSTHHLSHFQLTFFRGKMVLAPKFYPVLSIKSASLFIYNISCVCVMSHVFLPACIHNTATHCLCSQQCRRLSRHVSLVKLLASWQRRPTPPHTLCILANVGSNKSRTAS